MIPQYPIHWKGNPQLRVFLPLFWMKMIKFPQNLPKDTLVFEVHPQMTVYDVKNYLEKIYNVPVLTVRCHLERGKERHHPKFGYTIQPGADRRIAFVQLEEGHEFVFPDLFKGKTTEEDKASQDYRKTAAEAEKTARKEWSVQELPPWFR
jgi:large subunit ribosomal protein L23